MFRQITDEDFLRIEQLLLPAGQQFDQQRRDIINCIQSVDINACPGSGKTTVMLAKLFLLAEQMPLKNNQGICVLTHTNVAINEIKEKLGLSDTVLFKYPNHFGTIQSFINKFLGIPGYMAKFSGKRPSIIDQDWYNSIIAKRYAVWNGAGKVWIRNKPEAISLLQSYKFNPSFDNLLKKINGDPVFLNNGAAFNDIFNFKMRVMRDGILSYDDLYVLAEFYVNMHPRIKNLIQKRFPLLVIDEMQDTDTHQLSLLNQVFNPVSTIIQRIGDYNQAIFNKVTGHSVWAIGAQTLPLTGSKRFSTQIANQIDRICLVPRNMIGNPIIPNLQPRIIIFSQANILQVIPSFANMVIELDIPALSQNPCKAIGWVKESDIVPGQIKNCIKSYWPPYSTINKAQKAEYETLSEYLTKADEKTILRKGTSYYWDRMLLILLKLLRIAQVKTPADSFYSKITLIAKLKNHTEFYDSIQSAMIKWVREIQKENNVLIEIRDFIVQQFFPLFNIQADAETNNFLNGQNIALQPQPLNPVNTWNQFKHTYSGINVLHTAKQVDIHVSTIHGVKGETHAASLCLETFYFTEDIKKILRYLKIGQGAALPAGQVRLIEALKMAYVAMSRPSHFLCVAIRNEGITPNDILELEAVGWTVDVTLCN